MNKHDRLRLWFFRWLWLWIWYWPWLFPQTRYSHIHICSRIQTIIYPKTFPINTPDQLCFWCFLWLGPWNLPWPWLFPMSLYVLTQLHFQPDPHDYVPQTKSDK